MRSQIIAEFLDANKTSIPDLTLAKELLEKFCKFDYQLNLDKCDFCEVTKENQNLILMIDCITCASCFEKGVYDK